MVTCISREEVRNINILFRVFPRTKEGCPLVKNTRRKRSTRDSSARETLVALLESKPLHLWRLFREASLNGGACRDIVEKHVMCKLNRDGSQILVRGE